MTELSPRTGSHWLIGSPVAYVLILLLGLALYLPGLRTIPAVDRDEARFAQATRQMIESGDYVDIRLGNEARLKKPVGIYWLQAAATKLAGGEDITNRCEIIISKYRNGETCIIDTDFHPEHFYFKNKEKALAF